MIDFHDFSKAEYDNRYRKARELMAKKRLSAIIISEPTNCCYFSGFIGFTDQRPTFVILPLDKPPVLLIPSLIIDEETEETQPRRRSWIKDIKGYSLPFTYKVITSLLQGCGLSKGKIGMELDDTFFHSPIPYHDTARLESEMSKLEFVDASEIIWQLRIKKSEAEIKYLKKSAEIVSKSFDLMFNTVTEGMTERDVARILSTYFMELGADFPAVGLCNPIVHMLVLSSRPPPAIPTNKRLRKGHVVCVDSGAYYRGYCTEFTRTGVVGTPSDKQKEIWEKVQQQNEGCIKIMLPGAKMGDLPIWTHGVGRKHVEPPYPNIPVGGVPYNEILIKPGMTLATENQFVTSRHEIFGLEQNVAITEEGFEVISTARSDLYVIT